ncbi:MAG TPA: TonB-dependent receptor, partial [candidate division Zixibacteria bacterium]|nr:TonB-dependent receptor [candidate division Zixibacteria bacterium]
NLELKPEKSKSLTTEIFSDFKLLGKWRMSLEYRDVRYKDLIYWRRSQGIKYKPVNISASDFFSVTGTINYKAPADIIEINFSRVRSIPLNREDDESYYGKYIIHQPLYTNRLAIKFNYRILNTGADMLDSSHRFITEQNTKQLDCYTLVDLYIGLTYKIKFVTAKLEFRVNNLTDIEYELLEYQPMPPRSYNLSLTLKM